jgi:hypothetical protein
MLFARMRVKGKLIRRSLKTQVLSVAKSRLHDLERKERHIAEYATAHVRGKMIFGDTLVVYGQRLARVCFLLCLVPLIHRLASKVRSSRFEVRGWILNLRCSAGPVNHGPVFSLQLFLRAFPTSFSSSGNSFAFEARSK